MVYLIAAISYKKLKIVNRTLQEIQRNEANDILFELMTGVNFDSFLMLLIEFI